MLSIQFHFRYNSQSLKTFRERYETRARRGKYIIINQAYKLYDALWVLALGLNHTDTMIKSSDISGTGCESVSGSLVPLEEFNYTNAKIGCLIQWNIQQTNLFGLTVSCVSFEAK